MNEIRIQWIIIFPQTIRKKSSLSAIVHTIAQCGYTGCQSFFMPTTLHSKLCARTSIVRTNDRHFLNYNKGDSRERKRNRLSVEKYPQKSTATGIKGEIKRRARISV